jgi:hypothetical protein
VDVYDTVGIQSPQLASGLSFEAAWRADGAVCVRKVRIPEITMARFALRQHSDLLGQVLRLLRPAQALDCRTQRLGVPQPQRAWLSYARRQSVLMVRSSVTQPYDPGQTPRNGEVPPKPEPNSEDAE